MMTHTKFRNNSHSKILKWYIFIMVLYGPKDMLCDIFNVLFA